MPLDTLPQKISQKPARDPDLPSRSIDATGGVLKLVEICDGDIDVLGEVTTHAEAENIAWHLLHAVGPRDRQPVTVHKLALAYLAERGRVALT